MNIDEWYEHEITANLRYVLSEEIKHLSQMLVNMLAYSDEDIKVLSKKFHQTQGILAAKRQFLSYLTKPETEEGENDREKK
jgi:hypothetical protein